MRILIGAVLLFLSGTAVADALEVTFPRAPTTDVVGLPAQVIGWDVYVNGALREEGVPLSVSTRVYDIEEFRQYRVQVAAVNSIGAGEIGPATTVDYQQPRGVPERAGAPGVRILMVGGGGGGTPPPSGGGGGGDPYIIRGDVPSDMAQYINWPNAPVTTNTVNVTTSTFASNLSNGNRLVLADGNYGFVQLPADLTDVEIVSANPGGAVFSNLLVWYTNRVKIEGVETGELNLYYGNTDLLIDNCKVSATGGAAAIFFGNGDGNQQGPRAYNRIAIINSSVIVTGTDVWGMLNSTNSPDLGNSFILANSYINQVASGNNNDPIRIGHARNLIFADNWIQSVGTGNQFRLHRDIGNVLVTGNTLVNGAAQLFWQNEGDDPTNPSFVLFDNFYATDNQFHTNHNSMPFTAIAQGSTITNLRLTNNTEYSTAQATDGGVMQTNGNAVLNTNNVRNQAVALPTRTAGASF